MKVDRLDPVLQVLSTLKDNQLNCVFLREKQFFLSTEDDLDFWASTIDKEKLVTILLSQDWYIIGGKSVENLGGSSQVIRFKHDDCHPIFELWIGDLRAGSLFYCSEKDVSNNVHDDNGFSVANDYLLLSILVIRPYLKRRNLEKYQQRVLDLNIDSKTINTWLDDTEHHFKSNVFKACQQVLNGQAELKKVGLLTLLAMVLKQFSFFALIKFSFRHLSQKVKSKLYRPPLLSFVGTDGSGKSTTAETLVAKAINRGLNIDYIYAGRSKQNSAFVSFVRNIIFKLGLAKKVTEKEWEEHALSNKKGKKLASKPILALAILVYFIEYHIRYFKLKFKSYFTKKIYILDRGAWDISTLQGLGNTPVKMATFAPSAELTFFCYARPNVIQSRKLERSIVEIIRHQAIYTFLGRRINKTFIPLSTERTIEDVNSLTYAIFSTYLSFSNGELDKATFISLKTILIK